jgi:hypothetical protein
MAVQFLLGMINKKPVPRATPGFTLGELAARCHRRSTQGVLADCSAHRPLCGNSGVIPGWEETMVVIVMGFG